MKPSGFDYLRADSVDEVVAAMSTHGDDARILAGGLSLGAMMNYRLLQPKLLVDISNLEELAYIRRDGDWVEVGAATTQAQLMAWPELAQTLPLLHLAMPNIGHFQTRSRGTVCGSICHAEPSSELPLCFATLGGEAVLVSGRGERRLPASEFQTGMLQNARRSDELIRAVRFPVAKPQDGHAFEELALRKGDFAIVAAAAVRRGKRILLGIGGVSDKPAVRDFTETEGTALENQLNAFAWELGGETDIHASAKYRRHLVRQLGKRVIEEAKQC